jgi:hypothetical protein
MLVVQADGNAEANEGAKQMTCERFDDPAKDGTFNEVRLERSRVARRKGKDGRAFGSRENPPQLEVTTDTNTPPDTAPGFDARGDRITNKSGDGAQHTEIVVCV